jgi:hypothetical protein
MSSLRRERSTRLASKPRSEDDDWSEAGFLRTAEAAAAADCSDTLEEPTTWDAPDDLWELPLDDWIAPGNRGEPEDDEEPDDDEELDDGDEPDDEPPDDDTTFLDDLYE